MFLKLFPVESSLKRWVFGIPLYIFSSRNEPNVLLPLNVNSGYLLIIQTAF